MRPAYVLNTMRRFMQPMMALLQWVDMPADVLPVHHADGRLYVATARGGLWILK